MKVLIVKTSSLGDIIQAFGVLDYLHHHIPQVEVDWAVESHLQTVVAAHPLVRKTIPLSIKNWKSERSFSKLRKEWQELRKERYDVVFDLQKNTKSGLVTSLSRSSVKVGFGWKSVREWPNVLATNHRFDIPTTLNIRLQYVALLQRYFQDVASPPLQGVRFRIDAVDEKAVQALLNFSSPRIMVCPGSKWVNKQVAVETLTAVLIQVQEQFAASFYLMWGDAQERKYCEEIQTKLKDHCLIVDKLTIPVWQNLMNEMDLVVAVDSSALHLCGTTATPSFSLFGPTVAEIFKPIGSQHAVLQGTCPYEKTFVKQCPILRTCPTGACLKNLSVEQIVKELTQHLNRTFSAPRSL